MDQHRFEELERKRDARGLSDDEANELGRLIAEQRGQPYGNAAAGEHPDSLPEERGESAGR